MSIIACYSIKGGVGKTSTAVNLAYLSAQEGHKTLLWDLDLQGSAGFLLNAQKPNTKSIDFFTNGKTKIKRYIQPTACKDLHFLPADFSLRKLGSFLDSTDKPKKQLEKLIGGLSKKYSNIILDCPPGFSILTNNIFRIADVILAPVLPNPLSLENLDTLRRRIKKDGPKDLLLFPFFSMVDRRKGMHREIVELHLNGKRGFLNCLIPYSSVVERMAARQAPLASFSARSSAAKAYKTLWEELNTNIKMYNRVKKIKMWN